MLNMHDFRPRTFTYPQTSSQCRHHTVYYVSRYYAINKSDIDEEREDVTSLRSLWSMKMKDIMCAVCSKCTRKIIICVCALLCTTAVTSLLAILNIN